MADVDAYITAITEALEARDSLAELEAQLSAAGDNCDRDLKHRVREARRIFRLVHRPNIPALPGDATADAGRI